jgi:hypothetical protein
MKFIIISLVSLLSHFAFADDLTSTANSLRRASNARKAKGKEGKGKKGGKSGGGPITEAEIDAAQVAWCDALVAISSTYKSAGKPAAKALAQDVLDAAYGYILGIEVLFKPTLTYGAQTFRLTNDGALSYFVGDDSNYPSDTGFALKGWKKCHSERAGVLLHGDTALSMGNVIMENDSGVTKVDKTWGYLKDDEGNLRIVLHHSSLPYSPSP